MSSKSQRSDPSQGNRAQVISVGTPTAQTNDFAALMSGDNVVDARSPEFSTAELVMPTPDVAPTQPPAGQPEPAAPAQAVAPAPAAMPVVPETVAPPVAPAPPADEDKFAKMSPEELKKLARNQEQMIGRQSEEVGTYRKLFDKLQMTSTAPAAQQPPAPADPVQRFLKPTLSAEEKQELVALSLTDPEMHEEVQYRRFQMRKDAEDKHRAMVEEAARVKDIVATPEFQQFEKTLPPSVIQSALHDPQALRWVMAQFQGSAPAASAPVPPAPVPPAAPAPAPSFPADRVTRLGNAAGAPAAAVPQSLAPTFTRVEIAEMQLKRPQEYAMRQAEIIQAYREGRVR